MTIIHTDLPEKELLEALWRASAPADKVDDPGHTIVELADAWYGNHHGSARDLVSQRVKAAVAAGKLKQGWRYTKRVDGRGMQVRVFAMVDP